MKLWRKILCNLFFIFANCIILAGGSEQCASSKLAFFDCGDKKSCVRSGQVCDDRKDCESNRDEENCQSHFRKRCLLAGDTLVNGTSFINTYLGYDLTAGVAQPVLDPEYLQQEILDATADCRRVTTNSTDDPATTTTTTSEKQPLLPFNLLTLIRYPPAAAQINPQLTTFDSPYAAFVDLRRRKSLPVTDGQQATYESLQRVILSDAYRTSPEDPYWWNERQFWTDNSPMVRISAEIVLARFAMRSVERLVMNPAFDEMLKQAVQDGGDQASDDNPWWQLFERFGTHFPIGGTIGGSLEILARRRNCQDRRETTAAVRLGLDEIGACLIGRLRDDSAEACQKIEKKFSGSTLADIVDWKHRTVIGGDPTRLGGGDLLPGRAEIADWLKSIDLSNARALSTELASICRLIDQVSDVGRMAAGVCQRALVAYVATRDVLHVPRPAAISCSGDSVRIWRNFKQKYVLVGLPWCMSKTNALGACPAPSTANGSRRLDRSPVLVGVCSTFLLWLFWREIQNF